MTINLKTPSPFTLVVGIVLAIILVLFRMPLYWMLPILLIGVFIFDIVLKYVQTRQTKIAPDIPMENPEEELRDTSDHERRVALCESVLERCRESDQRIAAGGKKGSQPTLESLHVHTEPSGSITEEWNRFLEYKDRWEAGEQSLEMGLQLMFLAWELQDPVYNLDMNHTKLPKAFRTIYLHFGGTSSNEPEILFAAGYMISMFSWRTDVEEAEGEECLKKFNTLMPEGYPAAHFKDRGDYGRYFAYIISGAHSS